MSIETRNVLFFTFVFSMKFIKSVISLKYGFYDLDIGCSNVSTKDGILSVGPSQPHDGFNERSIILLVVYLCLSLSSIFFLFCS